MAQANMSITPHHPLLRCQHLEVAQDFGLLVPVICGVVLCIQPHLPDVLHGQAAQQVHHQLQKLLLQHQVHVLHHKQPCLSPMLGLASVFVGTRGLQSLIPDIFQEKSQQTAMVHDVLLLFFVVRGRDVRKSLLFLQNEETCARLPMTRWYVPKETFLM